MKKYFNILIQSNNVILKDHRVYGVRILPGVTYIDLLYRLIEGQFDKHEIALSNILFHTPLSTDGLIDRQLKIEIDCALETEWGVRISSRQEKEGVAVERPEEEHMSCSIILRPIYSEVSPMNPQAFIKSAERLWDMDDIYSIARSSDITHLDFMKTLGKVYQKGDEELMVLHLGASAEKVRATFKAAPPFLDGATFAGQSFLLSTHNESDSKERTPYIPFFIKRMTIYNQFSEQIFVYSKYTKTEESNSTDKPDIVKTDIVIYDGDGKVIAAFEELTAKRIRNRELIDRLVTPEIKTAPSEGSQVSEIPETVPPTTHFPKNTEERIRQFLRQAIGTILGKKSDEIKVDTGFYDLGLDSTQLLGLTKQLESYCGHEFYPTILFEYQTINEIAAYLLQNHEAVFSIMDSAETDYSEKAIDKKEVRIEVSEEICLRNWSQGGEKDEVAIVGLAGQYPEARNMSEFWAIVREAKDCIREIPENHWDVRGLYKREAVFNSNVPHVSSQWGGFIPDADKFDPLFFGISPRSILLRSSTEDIIRNCVGSDRRCRI